MQFQDIPELRRLRGLTHQQEFHADRLGFLRRASTEGGPICRFQVFGNQLVLVNTPEHTRWAADVTAKTFGEDHVERNADALMGSEDFAFMLEKCPRNYVMIGNGQGQMVHHPQYVFNQDLLPLGAAYWVSLVEDYMKKDKLSIGNKDQL